MQRDARLLRVHVRDLVDQLIQMLLDKLIAYLLGRGKWDESM